ncbi:serine protease [Saccharothrix sp. 6-C]|uniref:Subtilisin inhibitor-like n=1 Tax=Saccharothrix texasensis TaxID=103734 RepID=A0A3N1H1L0_9PSEU|nr:MULTISPECIES: SSI family serine proteinase inhibitor [Saccharothrix]QQQ78877.1 serine protease [Saccharothrix sp. 6-C]ROP36410.1 subtilisin inhibitor-like [Saccharothrix texasensis]
MASLFASGLLAAPLIATGTASAAPSETDLVLAVYQEETGVDSTRLTCDPAAGEHRAAQAACGEIEAADGDFTQLAGTEPQVCTFDYRPVTVVAFGSWRGTPVQYVEEFANRCVMEQETGAVFSF